MTRQVVQHTRTDHSLPVVFCELPRCRSLEIKTRKTLPQDDSSRLRYCRCIKCGAHFKLVLE